VHDWALRPENTGRNRREEAVPYNANRVVLMPLAGYENTYINASTVKGYFYPYILAQDPLDGESAFDFWRMIHDNNTYTIVMLSTEEDFNSAELYFPLSREKRLVLGSSSELTVSIVQEDVLPLYTQRRLNYRFRGDKNAITGRDVVQYAFRQWPSMAATPNSPSALLELIGRVLERQSGCPDAGPIVLHCRDGSAEAGVFCCVSQLLERVRSEHMIDVFRTVRQLQLQRPLLFTKIEQYAFCYDCVTEYLNSSCK